MSEKTKVEAMSGGGRQRHQRGAAPDPCPRHGERGRRRKRKKGGREGGGEGKGRRPKMFAYECMQA